MHLTLLLVPISLCYAFNYQKSDYALTDICTTFNLTYPNSYQHLNCFLLDGENFNVYLDVKHLISKLELGAKENYLPNFEFYYNDEGMVNIDILATERKKKQTDVCNCVEYSALKEIAPIATTNFTIQVDSGSKSQVCFLFVHSVVISKLELNHVKKLATYNVIGFGISDLPDTLQVFTSSFNFGNQVYISVNPYDFIYGILDNSPIAWVDFEFRKFLMVQHFLVKQCVGIYNPIGNLLLLYRLDSTRRYETYMEGGKNKLFFGDYSVLPKIYFLQRPFTAKHVRVQILRRYPNMCLKMGFSGFDVVNIFPQKPLIQRIHITDPTSFNVTLDDASLITGISFSQGQFLNSFCLLYGESETKNVYKDYIELSNGTIFNKCTGFIKLRSFRAKFIELSCLDWTGDVQPSNFNIDLFGSKYATVDYEWISNLYKLNEVEKIHVYEDIRGDTYFYGNSFELQKRSPEHKLMTDHFGADCFTRPHLCTEGFTVQLGFTEKPSPGEEVINLTPMYFKSYTKGFSVWKEPVLNDVDSTRTFIEYSIFKNGYYKVLSCKLNFLLGPEFPSFNVNITVFISQDQLFGDIQEFVEKSLNTFSNESVTVLLEEVIDLTKVVQMAMGHHAGIARYIGFLLIPETPIHISNGTAAAPLLTLRCGIPRPTMPLHELKSSYEIMGKRITITFPYQYVVTAVLANFTTDGNVLTIAVVANEFIKETTSDVYEIPFFGQLRYYYEFPYPFKAKMLKSSRNFDMLADDTITFFGYELPHERKIVEREGVCPGNKAVASLFECLNTLPYFDALYGNVTFASKSRLYVPAGCSYQASENKLYWNIKTEPNYDSSQFKHICIEITLREVVETFPILSLGISLPESSGTGFTIYTDSNDMLNIVVKTDIKLFRRSVKLGSLPEEPFFLSLVWKRSVLELFINSTAVGDEVIEDITTENKNLSLPNPSGYEYLLLFGDYHNAISIANVSLFNIKLWRTPLFSNNLPQIPFNVLSYFPLHSGFVHRGLDCNCPQVICFCEVLENAKTQTFESEKILIGYLEKDGTYMEGGELIAMDNYDSDDLASSTFIVCLFPRETDIKKMTLKTTFLIDKPDDCNTLIEVFVNNIKSNIIVEWCGGITAGVTAITPDLKESFVDVLKRIMLTNCLNVQIQVANVSMEVNSLLQLDYHDVERDDFYYIKSVDYRYNHITTFSLNVYGGCMEFKLKFGGRRFVYLTIFGIDEDEDVLKEEIAIVYRHQADDRWENIQLPLFSFKKVEFLLLCNDHAEGYAAFRSFKTSIEQCSNPSNSSYSIETYAELNSTLQSIGLPTPRVFVSELGLLLAEQDITVEHLNETILLPFLQFGTEYNSIERTLKFANDMVYGELSMLFWFQNKMWSSEIFLKTSFFKFQCNDMYIQIQIYEDQVEQIAKFRQSQWNFVLLMYSAKYSKFYIEINKVKKEFPGEAPDTLEFITLHKDVVNFQFFNGLLTDDLAGALKVPVNKQSPWACDDVKLDCYWCNVYYGELYLQHHSHSRNLPCVTVSDPAFYMDMESVEEDTVMAAVGNSNIKLTDTITSLPGIFGQALHFTSSECSELFTEKITDCKEVECFVAFWMKLIHPSENTIFLHIDSFALGYSRESSDYHPSEFPFFLIYKDCIYYLSAKSDVWVHLGFVFDHSAETISIFQNGERTNITCKSAKENEDHMGITVCPNSNFTIDEIVAGPGSNVTSLYELYVSGGNDAQHTRAVLPHVTLQLCSNPAPPFYYSYMTYGRLLKIRNITAEFEEKFQQITNVKHLELVASETYFWSMYQLCVTANIYITMQSSEIIKAVKMISGVKGDGDTFNLGFDQNAYYSRMGKLVEINKTKTSLIFEVWLPEEDLSYPIASCYISCWNHKEKTFMQSNNHGFFEVTNLTVYTSYNCCLSFSSMWYDHSLCPKQESSYITGEGEPIELVDMSIDVDVDAKLVNLTVKMIEKKNYKGIPYGITANFWLISLYENCTNMNSSQPGFNMSHAYNETLLFVEQPELLYQESANIIINTTEWLFERICICVYATTQNGSGIGVLNCNTTRTQQGAPEISPSNVTFNFSTETGLLSWDIILPDKDLWNAYEVPGTYLIKITQINNASYDIEGTANVSTSEAFLNIDGFKADNFYGGCVAAKSFDVGIFSDEVCSIPMLTKPDYMDVKIVNYSLSSTRTVIFTLEEYPLIHWRGENLYIDVRVFQILFNSSEVLFAEHNISLSLNASLEMYAGKTKPCNRSLIEAYFNQTPVLEYNFTGLFPYNNYTMCVKPCNEVGCGNASNNISFRTPSDVPSCPPKSLFMQNTSETSMILTWAHLGKTCLNGELVGYNITCNRSESDEMIETFLPLDNYIEFKDLEKYELLCCEVAAMTINGTGPYSNKTCAVTDESVPIGVPTINFISITNSSVNLTLHIQSVRDVIGSLVGIELEVTQCVLAEQMIYLTDCVSDANMFNHSWLLSSSYDDLHTKEEVITGLKPAMVYRVTSRIRNGKYIGPASSWNFTTNDSLSDAPESYFCWSDDVRVIQCNWTEIPLEVRYGATRQYKICHKQIFKNGSFGEKNCYVQDAVVHEVNITGLQRGSCNTISIAGINHAGRGKKLVFYECAMNFTDGEWNPWGEWSLCSVTCGLGRAIRERTCSPHSQGGITCSGFANETRECNKGVCTGYVAGNPGENNCEDVCNREELYCSEIFLKFYNDTSILSQSSERINCSNNIANGEYQYDYHPAFHKDTFDCEGFVNLPKEFVCRAKEQMTDTNLRRVCNCVGFGDLGYKAWAKWSPCNSTCGESQRLRKRICLKTCTGPNINRERCLVQECPIDGEWSSWTQYKECNASCGFGYNVRVRGCGDPVTSGGGTYCQGLNIDEKPECNAFPCPVHGGATNWTSWDTCNNPCGPANSTRRRYCTNPSPEYDGMYCNESLVEKLPCNLTQCRTIRVNVTITFKNLTWNWRMYEITSSAAQVTKGMVEELMRKYFGERATNVVCTNLKKGSVVVSYTFTFPYLLNQMVELYDDLLTSGELGGLPVGAVTTNSTDVFCLPPTDVVVEAYDKITVALSWKREECTDATWLYVFYKDLDDQGSVWERKGLPLGNNSAFVPDLVTGHAYKAYMLVAMSYGNGLPGNPFTMRTAEGPPTCAPHSVESRSPKSTQIYVEWSEIPSECKNGVLSGYRIKYKKYRSLEPYTVLDVQFGFNAFVVKNLKPYTLYLLEVYAVNVAGSGPTKYTMCKTIEDVPAIPVPNFRVKDMQSINWWAVFWGEIKEEFTNGVLLGYRMVYALVYRSGIEIGGELPTVTIDFDVYTRYFKARRLLNYAVYNVSVAGFTAAGAGPAPQYEARTCKCKENLYMNWFLKEPFVALENEYYPSGYLVEELMKMLIEACGACKDYDKSVLYFENSMTGDDPLKGSQSELKNAIIDMVDLSFPIYGQRSRIVAPDSTFDILVNSPGLVMVMRDETKIDDFVDKMVLSIFNVWPLLLISYLIATLFGICIWFTDQFQNPEEFALGSSLRGPLIGFWFAFVTMTTVGYGDQSPRTITARIFAMTWFLVGLVLNGMIIGFITTAITSLGLTEDISLYDTKTAAINNSFEYRVAVSRNAIIEKDVQYYNVTSMLSALEMGKVDVVYVDSFSLLGYQNVLDAKALKLASISYMESGYGYALSGLSQMLVPDMQSLVSARADDIAKFASSKNDLVPKLKVLVAGQNTADVFSENSPAFTAALQWLCILIGVSVFLGCLLDIKRRCRSTRVAQQDDLEQKSLHGELTDLTDVIQTFYENMIGDAETITSLHDNERVSLYELKRAYERLVRREGVEEADTRVRSYSRPYTNDISSKFQEI